MVRVWRLPDEGASVLPLEEAYPLVENVEQVAGAGVFLQVFLESAWAVGVHIGLFCYRPGLHARE